MKRYYVTDEFCDKHRPLLGGRRCPACLDAGLSSSDLQHRDLQVQRLLRPLHSQKNVQERDAKIMTRLPIDHVWELFARRDHNNRGTIFYNELVAFLVNCGGNLNQVRNNVDGFMRIEQLDRSSPITFSRFMAEYTRMQTFKAIRMLLLDARFHTSRGLVVPSIELRCVFELTLGKAGGGRLAKQCLHDMNGTKEECLSLQV
jgi:hypothetical protein